jgi:hypothetical protein
MKFPAKEKVLILFPTKNTVNISEAIKFISFPKIGKNEMFKCLEINFNINNSVLVGSAEDKTS